jgi:ribosomal protein L12E/L44/L45/RPP1/RPP2
VPLHTRRRVIVAVLSDILGLHSEAKAAVRWVHKVTGKKGKKKKRKKKKRKEEEDKKKEKEEEEEKEGG